MGVARPQVLTPSRLDPRPIAMWSSSAAARPGSSPRASWRRAGTASSSSKSTSVIGAPVHCTGVLGLDAFDELDLPRRAILGTAHAARFVAPDGSTVVDRRRARPRRGRRSLDLRQAISPTRPSPPAPTADRRARRDRRRAGAASVTSARRTAPSMRRARLRPRVRRELSLQPRARPRRAARARPERAARGAVSAGSRGRGAPRPRRWRPAASPGWCRSSAAERRSRASA